MIVSNVVSSNISQVGYELADQTMQITFKNGEVYEYQEVPSDVYFDLVKAQSVGKYFSKHVRNVYKYRKVEKTENLPASGQHY